MFSLAVLLGGRGDWRAKSSCPALPFHGFAEELVDSGLISTSLALEPGEHIGVHANRHRLLDGAIKLSHDRSSPFPNFRRIRQIDLVVRHPRQRSKLLCHLPRNLPHKPSFPAASLFAGGTGF